jgi:hypothetical protein
MQDQVCQHLRSLGIKPKESARWAQIIDQMIKHNGKEFTVSRLKLLVEALKNNVKTGEYHIPDLFATRVNKRGQKIIKDGLIHNLLSAKTDNEIFIAQSVFKVHTLIVIDEKVNNIVYPTRKQLKKFMTAVNEDLKSSDDQAYANLSIRMFNEGVRMGRSFQKKGHNVNANLVPLRYLPKGTKSSPVTKFYKKDGSLTSELIPNVKRDNIHTKDIGILIFDKAWNTLCSNHIQEATEAIWGKGDFVSLFRNRSKSFLPNIFIGSVNWIQEPSCKLRAVMSVDGAIQALAEALKMKTKSLIESFKQCHTSDHDAGRILVRDWLEEGKVVYAYDASNYTERLPLEIQLSILKGLKSTGFITEFDYKVFELASRGQYKDTLHDRTLRYKVGQPQGFGPSFNVATMAHLAIIHSCITKPHQHTLFSVIGDDVVIADKELADAYVKQMAVLGMQINQEKSLISDSVSEYAGKIITKESVILSAKIKRIHEGDHMKVTDRLLSHMSFYGSSAAWKQFSPAQKYYAYKSIEPLYVGGLDVKLPGDSTKDKFSRINWSRIRSEYIKTDFSSDVKPYSHTSIETHLQWITEFDWMIESSAKQGMTYTEKLRYFGVTDIKHAPSGLPQWKGSQNGTLFNGVKHIVGNNIYDEYGLQIASGATTVKNTVESVAISLLRGDVSNKAMSHLDYLNHGEHGIFPSLTPINRILIEAGISSELMTRFFDKKTGYITQKFRYILNLEQTVMDFFPEDISDLDSNNSRHIGNKGFTYEYKRRNENSSTKLDSNKGESGYKQPSSRPKGNFYPKGRD